MAERMVAYYCKGMQGRPELQDLCQYVYVILLEMDEARIVTAYTEGWLPFLVRRIIIRQVRSSHSPWRDMFRRYGLRNLELKEEYNNIPDDYV